MHKVAGSIPGTIEKFQTFYSFVLCTLSSGMTLGENLSLIIETRHTSQPITPASTCTLFYFLLLLYIFLVRVSIISYGHTRENTPEPVWSPKLSSRWLSQYCGGGPHGNTGCFSFFFSLPFLSHLLPHPFFLSPLCTLPFTSCSYSPWFLYDGPPPCTSPLAFFQSKQISTHFIH